MTTTQNTTASGAAEDLHPVFTRVLPDLPDTKPFTLFKAGFRQALATMASAPVAPTPPAKIKCEYCDGTGVDGDAGDDGRTIDVACGNCDGLGYPRYQTACPDGKRCLNGCLNGDTCRYTPEGFVQAPHYRGYANLGTGQYVLNHTAPHEPAELIISIASEEDKAGRTIGDDRGNPAGKAIQPDEMAVRLAFTSVAGLDALEKQLRYLREVHFPQAAPVTPAPQPAPMPYPTDAQVAAALAAAPPAQLSDGARYHCRKCGEQNNIEFNSARIVTLRPDGSERDPRDIASDPEGKLMHSASEPLRAAPVAPAPQPPAGLLSVGVRVKVLPNVTRYNQKPWVGKVGTIHALCGQHDWDVCFAGKPGYWDSFMRFDPSELEVCQDAQPAPLQQGEYLPLAVASAPDRIWLDLGFDPKETDADFSDLNTPTWSADNASGHGIEYVRADRASRGAAQAVPAEPDMRSVALAAGAYTTAYSMLTHAKVHNADVDGSTKRLVAASNGLRSALGPSAPVAEDAAYTELHGQINYIAAYSVDALDALDRDRLLGFARSLVWRAQTSLEIANLARAQAAQPEGGANANR